MPIRSVLFVALCCPLFLWLIEILAELIDRRRYKPTGELISIAGKKVHVTQQGTGPTVILESGLAASSISWILAQPNIAEFAHVISYDRAGLGWSAPSGQIPSLDELLSDLESLTRSLQLQSPLILVGHSFGGLLVSAYAHRFPNRVAGIVLVDPVSLATYADPEAPQRQRINLAIRLCKRGALLARFGIVRVALLLVAHGSRKLPVLIGRISAGKGSSVLNRLAGEIAKLPPSTHDAIRSHWLRPASFKLLAHYLALVPEAARQAQAMPIPAHVPVIVLSAATATPAELRERDNWTSLNPASSHVQIPNTSHWLQLDRPDVVSQAVRRLTFQ